MKKQNKTGRTIFRLLKYVVTTYKLQFAIVCISIIISSLVGVAGIEFLKYLIDDIITPMLSQEVPDYSMLITSVIVMGIIYVIGIIGTYVYNRLMINISQGILNKIRSQMFEHMQSLPIGFFDSRTHGEIMSTYTNDVDALRQALSQSIPQVFSSAITMISILISMFATNLYLTLVVLAIVAIMVIVSRFLGGNSSKFFVKQQENISKVNGYIEEMMEGQKVVKVFCYEEESKKKFDKINEELCDSTAKANIYANILMPCIMNIGNLGYVLVAVIGGILSVNGILTIGSIAAFLQFIKAFTNPIGQVSQQMNSVIMALAGAERIFDLMDEKPEEDDGYVTLVNAKIEEGKVVESKERTGIWAWKHPHQDGRITYTRLRGQVQFENVNFGYEPKKTVLHDITLEAKEGQKVSFVGATGAGKTTITNLINRFYDIQSGKIRYDRINIQKIKKDDLRRSLGMVLQDTNLFTGTIKDNIRYSKLDATDEEIYEAAKLSNADKFIRNLPEGYDTLITGNGEGLSQGHVFVVQAGGTDQTPVLVDGPPDTAQMLSLIHIYRKRADGHGQAVSG